MEISQNYNRTMTASKDYNRRTTILAGGNSNNNSISGDRKTVEFLRI